MEEFKKLKTISEVFYYMNKRNDKNILYMNELDIVGHDRTGRPGKFIYDYGNGESKDLLEKVIALL